MRTIQKKLLYIFSGVMLLVIFITFSLFYTQTLHKIKVQRNESLDLIGTNVANYLEGLTINGRSVFLNRDFMFAIRYGREDQEADKIKFDLLQQLTISLEDIEFVQFFEHATERVFAFSKSTYSRVASVPTIRSEEWYQKTLTAPHATFIEHTKYRDYLNINIGKPKEVINIYNAYIDPQSKKHLGLITLSINDKKLSDIMELKKFNKEKLVLLSETGEVIYPFNTTLDNEILSAESNLPGNEFKKGGKLYLSRKLETGQLLVNQIELNTIWKSVLLESYWFILCVLVSLAGLYLCLVRYLNKYIFIPLDKIAQEMEKIHLQKEVVNFEIMEEDDLKGLKTTLNQTSNKIFDLVNLEMRTSLQVKDAQILALQAQINPHFLYNSLQSIGVFALRNNSPDVYAMLGAMVEILRYSFKDEVDNVPLYKEIEHVRKYLYIQKIRFGTSLDFEINADHNVQDYLVPRLILQPLIENSIEHGKRAGDSQETIQINTYRKQDFLIISICDNGNGIEKKRCEFLNQILSQEEFSSGTKHLGLKNVLTRLLLIYGKDAKMHITSILGEGTTICLTIPIIEDKWNE